MPVTEYPEFAAHPEFVGLFVGGCVQRGDGSSFRAQAHAHNHPDDETQGWICVRSWRRLYTAAGTPSQVMLHELAHLKVPKQGHTDKWREVARSLGYRVRAHEARCYQVRQAWHVGWTAGSAMVYGSVAQRLEARLEGAWWAREMPTDPQGLVRWLRDQEERARA